ncbi:NAD-dependent epimerase/dehydratase family protein [Streptomyces sp. WMMC500]|uniref:NAD-dependent epimerase/dehydratase family protein n=1 Tax=Streptomyces sp. WMMC500 TaxID=3015154 RepID=UPI00248BC7E4|nr:NAD-dependent epimerase/dehydratase family protein [Streptomyces sp. WMMC500]WBB58367.1 NAD-dependent epimerase/dehydratase family protein [Streptomyces sp. WMMC500]
MRVLVTGGAGFIGSHVVSAFAERGHEAVVLDVRDAGPPGERRGAYEAYVHGDVRDRDAVAAALAGADAVCHQAAMVGLTEDFADAPAYVGANDLGTAVLLTAMADAGVRRLVLAGSMVVYGEGRYDCAAHGAVRPRPRAEADLAGGRFEPRCPRCGAELRPGLVAEDAPVDPRSVYAATKLAQEHIAGVWARVTGARAVSLRYHNVYGPGMPRDTPYAGVASFFRSALERGEAPRVYEDGAQRRDFVHVRDIAEANVRALEAVYRDEVGGAAEAGEAAGVAEAGTLTAYNAGSGDVHTVGELATALAAAYGGPAPRVTGEYRLGDVRHITADSARLRAELGWRPAVGFEEGVTEFAKSPLGVGQR